MQRPRVVMWTEGPLHLTSALTLSPVQCSCWSVRIVSRPSSYLTPPPEIYVLVKRTQPLKCPSVTMGEPTGATQEAGSSPYSRFCLLWNFKETVKNDGRGPPCSISEGLQRPRAFIGALHRVDGEQRAYFFWPPLVDILGTES